MLRVRAFGATRQAMARFKSYPLLLVLVLAVISIALVFSVGNTARVSADAGGNCAIPDSLPDARLEYPPAGEVLRVSATGNLLALSWSPQFCKSKGQGRKHEEQCGAGRNFAFILHGLWPDGRQREDPAWCRPAPALDQKIVRANFCMTPSVDLLQHEWAKHGTCAFDAPDQYFKRAALLWQGLHFPDMDALSRQQQSVGDLRTALVKSNPAIPSASWSIRTTAGNWLEEVRICYDLKYQPRPCPREDVGVSDDRPLKIWRIRK